MKQKRATVRSLAAELKVGAITVSRALRGLTTVRPELAERIRRLAEKRGYRADPVLAEVMGGLGRGSGSRYRETVAFVWTHSRSNSAAEERGARAVAEELGYRVETIKPWTKGLEEADVSRILWSRGIRGVLLAPNYSQPLPSYALEWERFAAVLIGSSLVNTGLTRVTRDYYRDMRLALERTRAEGHERVALVLDASTHARTERRYAAAFREHGTGARAPILIVDEDAPEKTELERMVAWLERERPDAVLSSGRWLQRVIAAGHRAYSLAVAPGDRPPGVRADFERIGAEAMRALDGLLRGNRLGLHEAPLTVLVPGTWTG